MRAAAQFASHCGSDEVARLDKRIGIDIGHRCPFEHFARIGIGHVDGRRNGPAGIGQRQERSTNNVVGEQFFDQPRRNVVPALHQHHQRHELGVFSRTHLACGGHPHLGPAGAFHRHCHQVVHRKAHA